MKNIENSEEGTGGRTAPRTDRQTQQRKLVAADSKSKPVHTYSPNHAGLGDCFADRYAQFVRYVEELGWMEWFQVRWRFDNGVRAYLLCEEMSRDAGIEAFRIESEEFRKKAVRFALAIGNKGTIDSVLESANKKLRLYPNDLDRHPNLVGVQNGVVDLDKGLLVVNAQELFVTKALGVYFHQKAKCELWQSALLQIMCKDEELVAYMQRLFGYIISGFMHEQMVAFFYGSGSNGKSKVVCGILNLLLAEYCHRASNELFVMNKFVKKKNELAMLIGKRLILASETKKGERLDEGLLKEITGDEGEIAAEKKYHDQFQFRPQCKIIISGNYKPVISSTDDGIWRRPHLVPFNAHFFKESELPRDEDGELRELNENQYVADPELFEKLKKELPGILNWAIAGYKQWRESGLRPPKAILDATKEYRNDEDLIGQFLEEKTIIDEWGDGLRIEKKRIHELYKDWCDEEGIRYPLSKRKLGLELSARGFDNSDMRHWKGLREKPSTE